MGDELNTISLVTGIVASFLYIASEMIAWSQCSSNSVSQFIYHNCVCSGDPDPPTPPVIVVVDDVEMACICNK